MISSLKEIPKSEEKDLLDVVHRMNAYIFGDPQTFLLAPPSGQILTLHVCIAIMVYMYLTHSTVYPMLYEQKCMYCHLSVGPGQNSTKLNSAQVEQLSWCHFQFWNLRVSVLSDVSTIGTACCWSTAPFIHLLCLHWMYLFWCQNIAIVVQAGSISAGRALAFYFVLGALGFMILNGRCRVFDHWWCCRVMFGRVVDSPCSTSEHMSIRSEEVQAWEQLVKIWHKR